MKNKKNRLRGWLGAFFVVGSSVLAFGKEYPRWFDPARHLPIEKVQRGMKGYGLSIFYGTKIERFEVKILDVVHNFEPRRNAILVELAGQKLERTGTIEGMSGSPVFLKDPSDGKYKIIGAVAFGWPLPCPGPPVCGVQPIEEMMVVAPDQSPTPILVSADRDFLPSALKVLASGSGKLKSLNEFDRFAWAGLVEEPAEKSDRDSSRVDPAKAGLYPLATPLGVAGISPRTFGQLSSILDPMNMTLIKTGAGSGGTEALDADVDKIQPAGVLAVPLVLGDLSIAAVGTVTDVVGDRIWGFGHAFFGQGPMELPISAGVIHTIIPNMVSSFKLGSPSKPIGTLYNDQTTAVAGRIGPVPKTIPLNIKVNFAGETQTFHYELAMHEKLAPLLAMICVQNSIVYRKDLPEIHTVHYSGQITFDQFGKVEFSNTSSNSELGMLLADIGEPLNLMMNNEFQRVKFKNIDVNVQIVPKNEQATIRQARLDKPQYRPGDPVRVELLLSRFRGPELTHSISFTVPDDLADGEYDLAVGGISTAVRADRRSNPYAYNMTSAKDIYEVIRRIESFQSKQFYIALGTNEEGLGLRHYGLKQLPGSKLQQLQGADPALTSKFSSVRLYSLPSQFVVSGQEQQLRLTVSRNQ
ncbi:MAG: hypothetical protein WC975_13195 [Phycisphaerae bacterium]